MSLFNTLIPSFAQTPARRQREATGEFRPSVKPAYDVKESADAWGVTVYLPGVAKDDLELTADDGEFRVVGRRAWKQPAEWTSLYRESADVPFELVLTHDNAINVENIHAELKDGVLRASLPKQEALKPRKIAVS